MLTAYNGTSTAVNNGRITALGGKSLTYSYLGLLATAGTTSYSYDTSGRRLSKTTGSTTTNYYYAGDMLVGEKTGNNKIEFLYDLNGEYYGFEYNDTPYYYFKNLQGDVVAIGEDYNTIVATYEYDAWGRLISSTDPSGINIGTINPIRYRSYYYDTETGFYYLKTRYYSPEICRFLSSDTEEVLFASTYSVSDKNLFAYCDNNPVLRLDDSGEIWVHIAVGAAVSGVSSFVSTFITSKGDVLESMISFGFGAAEGALSAAIPSFSPLFGAIFSAAESVVFDLKDGKEISEIMINATVSAGFGALSGLGDDYFSSKSFTDDLINVNSIKKNFRATDSSKAKREAVKAMTDFKKKCFKEAKLAGVELIGYTALEEGTKWYGRNAYSYATR